MHIYQRSDAGRVDVWNVGEIDDDVGCILRAPQLLKVKKVIEHKWTGQAQDDLAKASTVDHFDGKRTSVHDSSPKNCAIIQKASRVPLESLGFPHNGKRQTFCPAFEPLLAVLAPIAGPQLLIWVVVPAKAAAASFRMR